MNTLKQRSARSERSADSASNLELLTWANEILESGVLKYEPPLHLANGLLVTHVDAVVRCAVQVVTAELAKLELVRRGMRNRKEHQ